MAKKRIIAGMGRPRKPSKNVQYGGRVGARLIELCERRGMSAHDLAEKLVAKKIKISWQTVYAYQKGKDAGGADLPLRLVPIIGKIFGYNPPTSWLP